MHTSEVHLDNLFIYSNWKDRQTSVQRSYIPQQQLDDDAAVAADNNNAIDDWLDSTANMVSTATVCAGVCVWGRKRQNPKSEENNNEQYVQIKYNGRVGV